MTAFAQKLKTYRLNQGEYDQICRLLGREPQGVEWALFSALWSEHCSYKSSKVHLRGLFNKSPRVLQSMGENAGVLDLGHGEKIAFKMESHNHPSFIEPYQGAATGVGGILRDVFTMGARPVMLANYLCFGDPKAPRMQSLVDGVVRGISGYGNCVGVPNVTGQTEFHSSYNNNILVNAFALGLFREGDPIALSKAKGEGNLIVYVGAKTGRDGVHGASMASESFDQNSESKRPTIQIGDPFFEKLLIESCLEVIRQDLVVAIQDMGAAGLTSSSFEMAAKGEVGFDIDLSEVPLRDSSLTPEDILLSESQERMLLICEPKNLAAITKVFSRWDLDAKAIGKVTNTQRVILRWKGEVLTDLDPRLLVDHAPVYNRSFSSWTPKNRVGCDGDIELDSFKAQDVVSYLRSAQGTSRKFIYRQYDQRVGGKTARDCSNDLGVIRLPDSGRGLGVVLGCRPHIMRFDAMVGGIDSVAFPALELASKGFEAVGVTDCLNFGNPEKNEIMSEFVASLRGMNQICESLGAPIISGNVSFYNETENRNITSTPATGVVGVRDGIEGLPSDQFTKTGESVWLIQLPGAVLGGLAQEISKGKIQGWGDLNIQDVGSFCKLIRSVSGQCSATRVVGKFGLGYTLARMSLGGVGVQCDQVKDLPAPRDWVVERLYEVVMVSAADFGAKVLAKAEDLGLKGKVQAIPLGTTSSELKFLNQTLSLSELKSTYEQGWGSHFEELA